jgi:hypothetical protein
VLSIENANPKPDLGQDLDTCYNTLTCFNFKPTYAQTYWNGSRTSRDTFCTLPGNEITVMVVDENTCIGYDTLELSASNSYINLIDADTIYFPSPEIQVEVDNGDWESYLWTGKSVLDGENSWRALVFGDGWYKVVVTDANGCTETDSVYAKFETSIIDYEGFGISIYPNPANDLVQINSKFEIKQVTIYSLSGQQLTTGKSSNLTVSHLKPGIYLIEVFVKDVSIKQQLIISR